MKIRHKLTLIITLMSASISIFASNCSSLESLGNTQGSIIKAAQGISLDNVNTCLAQCNTLSDSKSASQCVRGLSVLQFAVNYNDSLKELDPDTNTYASSSGVRSSAPLTQPTTTFTPPTVTTEQKSAPLTAPSNPGYLAPSKTKSDSKNSLIHWY